MLSETKFEELETNVCDPSLITSSGMSSQRQTQLGYDVLRGRGHSLATCKKFCRKNKKSCQFMQFVQTVGYCAIFTSCPTPTKVEANFIQLYRTLEFAQTASSDGWVLISALATFGVWFLFWHFSHVITNLSLMETILCHFDFSSGLHCLVSGMDGGNWDVLWTPRDAWAEPDSAWPATCLHP